MIRQWGATVLVVGLMASTAAAQDAKTVIASASKAMGADNLTSITFLRVWRELRPWAVEQRQRAVAAHERQ
jgi:hypothetical protein